MNFYCLALITACLLQQTQAYNYCYKQDDDDYRVCGKGTKHMVCDPDQIPIKDTLIMMVTMTEKMKNLFLEQHNAVRNNTACGSISANETSFPTATRLRQLVWDDELAYSAHVHAQRCNMKHNACHSTKKMWMCGQNLAAFSGGRRNLTETPELFVGMWYKEYKTVADPTSFPTMMNGIFDFGHYSVMVMDRTSRVGCAVSVCKPKEGSHEYNYYGTCNYDGNNIIGTPVYIDGEVGSKCSDYDTERSSKYECLCENNGKIYGYY